MYCTKEELAKRYRSSFINEADANKVDQCLKDAQSLVDTYISGIVAIPLSDPIPIQIVRVTADLAMYYLLTSTGHFESDEAGRLQKSALDLLKDIAKGVINPFATPDPTEEPRKACYIKKEATEW